jgi:PAS domain S-box-containing protein
MKPLRSISIKTKLIMIIVGVSFTIAIAGFLVVFLNHISSLKEDLKNNTVLNAELVGQYCVVPLTFQYVEEANEVLNKLSSIPYIIGACVYDENGEIFAAYAKDEKYPRWPALEGRIADEFFENNFLHVFHRIVYQDKTYGTIYLKVITTHLRKRIINELLVMLPVILALLLVSFFIAFGLQRPISQSIRNLADVAQSLAEKKDYSVRVQTNRDDEIGVLYKRFNYLCEQIERREKERDLAEAQIRQLNEELEARVKNRTAKLAESEQRLKLALQGGNLGFWDVNFQTEETIFNERWAQMLGYSLDEIENTRETWLNSIHPDDRERVLKVGEDYRTGRIPDYEVEYRAVTKEKDIIWQISKGAIVERDVNGDALRMVGTVMDITERKHMEEDLIKAKEAAEEADRIKSAFLATMSHELRTPLNAIIGFTGIMLQELAGPLNEEQRKQLTMVQNSSRHLLALINDVLDISKIEAGQLDLSFATFELRPSIEKMVALVAPLAEKKGIDLRMDIAGDIKTTTTDQRRLEQIILNLLNNAVKFTEKGHVLISCHRENDHYLLSVTDTGIGMQPEELPGLFQPFYQIDTGLSRKHEGTGLGLSICKKLLNMMEGEISVESRWGVGSTFTIRFPREKGALS